MKVYSQTDGDHVDTDTMWSLWEHLYSNHIRFVCLMQDYTRDFSTFTVLK